MSYLSRNSAHVFFAPMRFFCVSALVFLLNGCAASKGFLAGAVGGVPLVDEYRHDEFEDGSAHSGFKQFVHGTITVWLAYSVWPLALVYGTASGSYGAYHFWKADKEAKAKQASRSSVGSVDLNE